MIKVDDIDKLLPQTQCGECSFSGCRPYAEALAQKTTEINRCPPGGVHTLKALGTLLQENSEPFVEDMRLKTRLPSVAVIREAECIGCTKCIKACPVDAIIGTGKQLHAIIAHECTGCGLCVEPCPVDCIEIHPLPEPDYDKERARTRFHNKQMRLVRDENEKQASYRLKRRQLQSQSTDINTEIKAKQDYIKLALARVHAKKT